MKIILNKIKEVLDKRKENWLPSNIEHKENLSWVNLFINQDDLKICGKIIYSYDERTEPNKEDYMYMLDFDYFLDPFSLVLEEIGDEQYKIKWDKKIFGEITEENVIKIWDKYKKILKKMTLFGRSNPRLKNYNTYDYLFPNELGNWEKLENRDGEPMLIIEQNK